ncbi:MAG: VOC family protein [Acetobacteraceae bacterium]
MTHGTFYWNELMTPDTEAAKRFFADTIGWTYQGMPMPEGTYWLAQIDGKPVGGIMAMQGVVPDGTPPHWVSYLAVDDVDARIARLSAAGGTVCRSPFDVPGVGRIAIVADPTGAVMGWITPVGA